MHGIYLKKKIQQKGVKCKVEATCHPLPEEAVTGVSSLPCFTYAWAGVRDVHACSFVIKKKI